jgi:hypothetical protein
MEGEFIRARDLPDAPTPSRAVQVRYRVNGELRLQALGARVEGPLTVSFALANLRFDGNEWTDYDTPERRSTRDTLRFNLRSRAITLRQVKNYGDVVERLGTTEGAAITAVLTATATSLADVVTLRDDVTRLCALLTLATGCKVASAGDDARTRSGRIVGGCRVTPPVRPFATFTLIDTRNGASFVTFIETVFDTYCALEHDYELARVIDARVDAVSGGFLETRTLMAGVLADYLTRRYANLNQLRVRSFDERLRFMVKRLCPDVRAQVSGFINTRDHLVHEMRFSTSDPAREHLAAIYLVSRLILGLLRYTGPLVDCREWKTTTQPQAPR